MHITCLRARNGLWEARSIEVKNLVIIGSGLAGYTAAIYTGLAQLKSMFEGFEAGGIPGGQLMTTNDVKNFPGFPEGIQSPHLMHQIRQQALRWGAKCITKYSIAQPSLSLLLT